MRHDAKSSPPCSRRTLGGGRELEGGMDVMKASLLEQIGYASEHGLKRHAALAELRLLG